MSDAGGQGAEPVRALEIGGSIRRVVILTAGLQPAACYLARRLRPSGVQLSLVNQERLRVEPGSLRFFLRLYRRRGVWAALDVLLLEILKAAVRLPHRVRRGRGIPSPDPAYPVLAPDPGILDEGWLGYHKVADVNRSPDQDLLRSLEPDLVLLAGAPILSRDTIEIARVACVNPHCGISPDYAGSSPFDWAIFEGRFQDVGYTIHLVVPVVDAGPILHQERLVWDPSRPNRHLWPILAQRMYDKLAEIALDLIRGRTFKAIPQGTARPRPPAGLYVRTVAELRRAAFARRRKRRASSFLA